MNGGISWRDDPTWELKCTNTLVKFSAPAIFVLQENARNIMATYPDKASVVTANLVHRKRSGRQLKQITNDLVFLFELFLI